MGDYYGYCSEDASSDDTARIEEYDKSVIKTISNATVSPCLPTFEDQSVYGYYVFGSSKFES